MSACGAWRGVARLLGYCGVIYLGRCLRDDHVEGVHSSNSRYRSLYACRRVRISRGKEEEGEGGGVVAVFA